MVSNKIHQALASQRFDAKEKRIGLGRYPDVPLSLARERREQARQLLAKELDPSAVRQAQKASSALIPQNSFVELTQNPSLKMAFA